MTAVRLQLAAVALMSILSGILSAQEVAPVPIPPEPAVWEMREPESERELTVLTTGLKVGTNADLVGSNGELWLEATGSPFPTGLALRAFVGTPNIFAQLGTSTSASAFHVTNASGGMLVKIQGDGGVAIGSSVGTPTQPSRLSVFSNTIHHLTLRSNNASAWNLTNYNAGYFGIAKEGAASPALAILNSGDVGIGTSTPTARLHVNGNVLATGTLTVTGNIAATGSITGATVVGAIYQDLAEWVPASSDMEPGTVVVLNHDRTNEVMLSHRAYDTSVAGVVSAQPGILLGVAGDAKEQIATTGRVKVRVDATAAPIRIGDLLVSSGTSGRAMRSEPMEINGRKFHQPGTIIGKALESLDSGQGEILVLLSLQ